MARIFSLWVGSNLSVYEKLTLASALKHNHDFTLFSYEPLEVPTGIIIADANLVIPKSEIKQINQSFASFSNRFRYTVLLSQSFDAWVDMDIVLNSEKLPSNMGYRFGYENKRVVNNAVVGYPAESVLAKKLILNSENVEKKWGSTGPKLLTALVEQESLQHYVLDTKIYYPIGPWEINLILTPGKTHVVEEKVKDSHTIHLWMDILKRFGFCKDKLPPHDTYLRKLLEEFDLVEPSFDTFSKNELLLWKMRFETGKIKHYIADFGRTLKALLKL